MSFISGNETLKPNIPFISGGNLQSLKMKLKKIAPKKYIIIYWLKSFLLLLDVFWIQLLFCISQV